MSNIKILREKSGAGMVDCKKALEESGGDIEKAMDFLRKKGIAKAAKRSGREASEGVVMVATNEDGNEGYLLEINSETDFVSRNEKFQKIAQDAFDLLKTSKPADLAGLLSLSMENGTLEENLASLSGTIGENIGIKRFAVLKGVSVAAYSHAGGRMGVLVSLNKAGEADLAKEVTMQIAASNPKYIKREEVPVEEMEREKEIYKETLKKEGKPEQMMEKIISGKLDKYYEDVCLLEQEYIKDEGKKIKDILNGVEVEKFIRYSL